MNKTIKNKKSSKTNSLKRSLEKKTELSIKSLVDNNLYRLVHITYNKILVLYNAPLVMAGDANSYAEMRLFRGSTELRIFTDIGCYNNAAQTATQTYHYDYLDSPSTTSRISYYAKYAEHGSSTLYLNHSGGSGGAGSSTFTLLEVLA